MIKKKVVHGPMYRIQVQALDFRGCEFRTPEERVVRYMAHVLPQHANKYAAFSSGRCVYFGTDDHKLMEVVRSYATALRYELPEAR